MGKNFFFLCWLHHSSRNALKRYYTHVRLEREKSIQICFVSGQLICAVSPLGVYIIIGDNGAPRSVVVIRDAAIIRLSLVDEGKHTADGFDLCLCSGLALDSAVFPLKVYTIIRDGCASRSIVVNSGAAIICLSLVDEGKHAADVFDLCLGFGLTLLL